MLEDIKMVQESTNPRQAQTPQYPRPANLR